MSSPLSKMKTENSDPYDISMDDDIIQESDREIRLRRASQQKKKELAQRKSAVAKVVDNQAAELAEEGVDDEDLEGVVVNTDGEFLCPTCPRSFRSIVGRQRHLKKCRDDLKDGICPCCNEDVKNCHQEGEIMCGECDGLFLDETQLARHIEYLHRIKPTFSCACCPRVYYEKEQLVKHLAVHSEEKPWMCKKCNAVFTRKYHLIRHFRQSGCDGVQPESNVCQVCNRSFSRKDNLREHLRAHAGINKRLTVYTCEYCNDVIAGLNAYNSHKREMHVGDKPYKCSYCPMRFTTSGAMKKHMRTHTGERPYQCKECLKKFAAKETLNRHMKTHNNDPTFECSHCGKRFVQHAQLRTHIFVHTGIPDFRCERCPEAFRRKQHLMAHEKLVHEGFEPFLCNHCNKPFLSKRDLIKHIVTKHIGLKEFKCDKCSKRFAQKQYLRVHALTHTREQPRACNYCNRAFIRQDCLLRHMRNRHKDKIEMILIEAERKKLQMQLMEYTKSESVPVNSETADELAERLPQSISDLLSILVDEETLQGFGYPNASIGEVLKMVIKRCGHSPVEDDEMLAVDVLRANAKLLFTVVIDDAGVKSLLNNQSVDEVIQHVLNLVKS